MKNYMHIPTILILLCLLSTCTKDMSEADCPCTEDESLQNLYDWLYFEEGTYWIYEEENSGALDTVTVYQSFLGDSFGWDSFEYFSYSSYFDYNFYYSFSDSFSRNCASPSNCTCRKIKRTKSRPGDFVGAAKLFRCPVVVGNFSALLSGGMMTVTDRFDTLQVGQLSIPDVFRHHITEDPSEGHTESVYYLSKHLGIVKKELIAQEQVWNLKEYSILQ